MFPQEKKYRILGIETSCDETAVAVVDSDKNILSNLLLSQIDLHNKFGGVVPELAARSHLETLDNLIVQALQESNLSLQDISAIAATSGPGLIGGIIVGIMMAKTISSVIKKPFIAVNHLEAHLLTVRLVKNVQFPFLVLLFSGGHCQILIANNIGDYELLGSTIDDALGEAFDKVAQMLGLKYPGGPEIEKYAINGDENRFNFPKPLIFDKNHLYNFSFSGLKTAIRREIEKLSNCPYNHFQSNLKLSKQDIADISASFQKTVSDIIISRLGNIFEELENRKIALNNVIICGGVAANRYLFGKISEFVENRTNLTTISPPINLCTDNAAMVAWTGIEKFKLGLTDQLNFTPKARWNLNVKS